MFLLSVHVYCSTTFTSPRLCGVQKQKNPQTHFFLFSFIPKKTNQNKRTEIHFTPNIKRWSFSGAMCVCMFGCCSRYWKRTKRKYINKATKKNKTYTHITSKSTIFTLNLILFVIICCFIVLFFFVIFLYQNKYILLYIATQEKRRIFMHTKIIAFTFPYFLFWMKKMKNKYKKINDDNDDEDDEWCSNGLICLFFSLSLPGRNAPLKYPKSFKWFFFFFTTKSYPEAPFFCEVILVIFDFPQNINKKNKE